MNKLAPVQDQDVLHVLMRIRQLTRGVTRHSRALNQNWGVTVPQLLCLRALSEQSSATPGSVAKSVNLNSSTVTGILDRLEKRGLVRRERTATDRRVITLVLTESGRDFLERAPIPLQERFVERLVRLPGEELERVMTTLDLLVRLLEVEDEEVLPILDELSGG